MTVRSRRSVASQDVASLVRSAQANIAHAGSVNMLPGVEDADQSEANIASGRRDDIGVDDAEGRSTADAATTRRQLPFDAEPILDDPSLASFVVAAAMCVYIVAPTMT